MAFVATTFKLDLTPGAARQVLYTSQGDIGRPFEADLYWNGSPWTATGTTASIRGKKPDDTVFDYTATVSGAAVTFETTEQMTIIPGPVECELVFSQSGDVIASANFVLIVEDSPYNPDAPSESVIPGIEDLIEQTIGGDVRDEVQAELEAHPEWTTTVQDGAITKAKINTAFLPEIENAYVTPEMFGAVGDGVTDDTAAWQAAVNVGAPVLATKKQYKCGQINVTKNITIDCGGAAFTCTGNRLFYVTGEVVETLTGEPTYYANNNYSITDADYADYTGFAMLKGTNNFEKARTYYYGGFVCTFDKGNMCQTYPIDVTGTSIEIVNPITAHIRRVGNVSHVSPSASTRSIEILYGYGCTVKDVKNATGSGYMFLAFNACLNCIADIIDAQHSFTSDDNNSYIVSFLDSSFCCVSDSHLFNEKWHAVTTGGNYLCYKNRISNGSYLSGTNYAISDHDNALGTTVENVDVSGGCGICGRGYVRNINILPNDANMCFLQLRPSSTVMNAVYNVENVNFFETRTSANYSGVRFSCAPQTSGNTYYIDSARFKNIFQTMTANAAFEVGIADGSYIDVRGVNIDNTNLNIFVCKTPTNNAIVANSNLFVSNVNSQSANTRPGIGAQGYEFNNLTVSNSFVNYFRGSYKKVALSTVEWLTNPTYSDTQISVAIYGTGLKSKINNDVLLASSYVQITDMLYGSGNNIMFCVTKDNAGNVYGHRMLNGTWTKVQFT